jgi:molybdopterin molybdotransferase
LSGAEKPGAEAVELLSSSGRILAQDVVADRDYPAAARSVRDGFAVRSADLPGELQVTGEVRAGESAQNEVRPGEAIEIMTGAPVPVGADAVLMVEHVTRDGDRIHTDQTLAHGENINPRGAEAREGSILLAAGSRIGYSEIALFATVGLTSVQVFRKPSVAIIPTGDEIVEVGEKPLPHQVRNSNTYSLADQVQRAGGEPVILPIARDNIDDTRALIEQGLKHDLLLLSGGVSAGKYDLVEPVLESLGAEFFFTRVLIQPGQPLVFGRARGKFFFGLPGNPASTIVTFEIFARVAVEILAGLKCPALPVALARLTADLRVKPGLTRFLPAVLDPNGVDLTPVRWKGSGDVPALARANAFLITDPGRESWAAGDLIRVLIR